MAPTVSDFYDVTVKGVDHDWKLTLPNQVTLSQEGSAASGYRLDGLTTTPPLVFNIDYDLDLRYGGYHGVVTIKVTDLQPNNNIDETVTTNGLRGPVQFNFTNDLGVPLQTIPGTGVQGSTMALYLGGTTDNFDTSGTASFHTLYTHFHPTGANQNLNYAFPGAEITTALNVNNTTAQQSVTSPNWIYIDDAIAAGQTVTWGPMTFHQRDTDALDNGSINIMTFNGALTPADAAKARAEYEKSIAPPVT